VTVSFIDLSEREGGSAGDADQAGRHVQGVVERQRSRVDRLRLFPGKWRMAAEGEASDVAVARRATLALDVRGKVGMTLGADSVRQRDERGIAAAVFLVAGSAVGLGRLAFVVRRAGMAGRAAAGIAG
jgi:hypothetical protein